MSLKITLLCASILVGCVVGKTKTKQQTTSPPIDPSNGNYGNQNGYPTQEAVGYPNSQDGYNGYVQPDKNTGFISGHVRRGETLNIGNGRGHTNVVAINSDGETDYYYGYTDGTVGKSNPGYQQTQPPRQGQNGIVVNRRPGGQEDVLLWNKNGNKQSAIEVNENGAQLYSGNSYDSSYQTNYQSGYGRPSGRNDYQSSSSIISQQDQVYLNSRGYK